VNSENKLCVTWPSGSGWVTGAVTGPNAADCVTVDPISHYVWYRGRDHRLYVAWWTGSGWGNGAVTGPNVSDNVAVDPGTHFVWYRGTDAKLYVTWWTGRCLGNAAVSGPTVGGNVVVDSGNHYVWYRGLDAKLYVTWWAGNHYGNAPLSGPTIYGRNNDIDLSIGVRWRSRRGPRHTLCLVSRHRQQALFDLVDWDHMGQRRSYPAPMWTLLSPWTPSIISFGIRARTASFT